MAQLRRVITVIAVSITLLLAGCAQTDPAGQPTYSCTPDDGSSPYACYKVQYDAKAKEAALYAEAEAVYRKFLAEDERVYRAGGITEPSATILETTTGQYQEDVMAGYRGLKSAGATASGGEFKIGWFKKKPHDSLDGSIVTLAVCTDTSSVQMAIKGKPPRPGQIIQETGYFVREGATLKITSARSKLVTSC